MKQTDFLHIIPSLDPKTGGPAAEIQALIPALEARGISNEVACSSISGTKITEGPKVPVHEFAALEPFYRFSPALFLWGIKNISRFKVIIIHGLWQFPTSCYLLWMMAFCFMKRPFPIFYVKPHGMLDPWFQKSPSRRLKAIRNFLFWHLIERWCVNSCNGLLFGCRKEMALAWKTFHFYRPKSQIKIGYFVKPAPKKNKRSIKIFRKRLSIHEGEEYLLFLSRIDPKKGLHLLIPAFAEALTTGITLPILVMAGPGWESPYGKKIQVMASEFLPKNSYRIVNSLSGDQKWAAFYGCLTFILPSQQENFGIAVVEALSCNRPVIITNQVNIWREIKKENAGIVCSAKVSAIKKALLLFKAKALFGKALLLDSFDKRPLNAFIDRFDPLEIAKLYTDLKSARET